MSEEERLAESRARKVHWKRWGPYLAERQWGTVREDYSPDGSAWGHFPFDHARSRAYRWGEDGLGGICDRGQHVCFAFALWNGRDPFLKERLFGLGGTEGNHGEDVKECYFYLDSTPTHSYMRYLYKYPQAEFPYARLRAENRRRGEKSFEFELMDTGVFEENRYFDVFVEYAKAGYEDLLVRIEIVNRGPDPATLDLLPTVWFRNTWSWGSGDRRPRIRAEGEALTLEHPLLGAYRLACENRPSFLFTENETNRQRLWGAENESPYVKDGINDYVVQGAAEAVNPAGRGSKAAARYQLKLAAGASTMVRLRLASGAGPAEPFGPGFEATLERRREEADAFYAQRTPGGLSADARNVLRQATRT